MPSVRSDGVHIHYELVGDGFPLVLIGGLAVHTGEYRVLIDALAQRHRVLATDNRGVGLSDKPDAPYSYSVMAADSLAAMNAIDFAAADIVGFSMGARIAVELCLTARRRARTLTLIAGRLTARRADAHVCSPSSPLPLIGLAATGYVASSTPGTATTSAGAWETWTSRHSSCMGAAIAWSPSAKAASSPASYPARNCA